MICKECFYVVNHSQDPHVRICTLCGADLFDEPDDMLLYGKYNIVSEVRPTQAKLSNNIHELMIRYKNAVLLGEGGTGIGKSFAYLIPAILQNKRVIISTAKKSLQRQLVQKDLPHLLNKMRVNRSYVLFKGVANYACAKQMHRHKDPKFQEWMLDKIQKHIPADLSDWPEKEPEWWGLISGENCINPKECEQYSRCRPHPQDYQIVVVNHSILAIDILLGKERSHGHLLGPYDTVIVDEAHQAAEMFKRILMQTVTIGQTERLRDLIKNHHPAEKATNIYRHPDSSREDPVNILQNIVQAVTKAVNSTNYTSESYSAVTDFSKIAGHLEDAAEDSIRAHNALNHTFKYVTENPRQAQALIGDLDEALYFLNKAVKRIARIRDTLLLMTSIPQVMEHLQDLDMESCPESNWLLTANNDGVAIQPLELGPILGPKLKQIPYKVLLSATLRYENSFDYIKDILGIEELPGYVVKEGVYESPFDYEKQARFYIPAYQEDGSLFPIPPAPEEGPTARKTWIKAIAKETQRMIIGSRGDALVLCSSKVDLADITSALNASALKLADISIIKQEGDAGFAYDKFMATPRSVLFGLKSFWEGIDIQGSKLRLVIIPKLPFPTPSDPVIVALTKRIGDSKKAFYKLSVPQMIFDIKQGKGRLIRSKTDKGAVAILDSRVLTSVKDLERRTEILHEMHTSTNKKKQFPTGYGARVIIEMGIPIRARTFEDLIDFINS